MVWRKGRVGIVPRHNQVTPADLASFMGEAQRRAFEQRCELNVGWSVPDMASAFGVAESTIRRVLNQMRRTWDVRTRNREVVPDAHGKRPAGRPEVVYYLREGHRWAGAGRALASVVLGAGGMVATPGVVGDDTTYDREVARGNDEWRSYMDSLRNGLSLVT